MKLNNGDEVVVGIQRYRVIGDELHEINRGSPPLEKRSDKEIEILKTLPFFNIPSSNDACPKCGGDKYESGGTGCGREHYGTYCLV